MEQGSEHRLSRILIAELDSVQQAARYARIESDPSPKHTATAEITAMIRVGRLISGTVLLTDTMLLDGQYFMQLGPEGVLRELASSDGDFPLVITGRAASLAEGLEYRLHDPGFTWSLPSMKDRVAPPAPVRSVWNEWLSYVDRGLITYEQQTSKFVISPATVPPYMENPQPSLLNWLDSLSTRSEAWDFIDTSAGPADREHLKSWWNGRYLRAIATTARADWLSFEVDRAAALSTATTSKPLHLPRHLLTWARDAAPATVGLAWDAARDQRQRLQKRASWSTLRDLAYVSTRVGSSSSRRRTLFDAAFRFAIAVALVLLSLPGVEAATLDNPVTWIVFAGVILTTIPFDALGALIELMRPDPRSTLILYSNGGPS